MNKLILRIIIITYLLIIVLLPIIFYINSAESKSVKFSVGVDLSTNIVSIYGDPTVLNDVTLNDQQLKVVKQKGSVYTEGIISSLAQTQKIRIIDKDGKNLALDFALLPRSKAKKNYIKVYSKIEMQFPEVLINNSKQFVSPKNIVDAKMSLGDNYEAYIDFIYWPVSVKEKLRKKAVMVFLGSKELAIKTGSISLKVFKGTINFFKLLKGVGQNVLGVFKTLFLGQSGGPEANQALETTNVNSGKSAVVSIRNFFINLGSSIKNLVKSFVNGVVGLVKCFFRLIYLILKAVYNLIMGLLTILKNAIVYVYKILLSPISGSDSSRRKQVFFQDENKLKTVYQVGETIKDFEVVFVNGLGEPLVDEKVVISLKAKKQNTSALISERLVYTDQAGKAKVSIKFGSSVCEHKLIFIIKRRKMILNINVISSDPVMLKNLKETTIFTSHVGKFVKNAIELKVLDKFDHPVPNAVVYFFENDLQETTSIKYAEVKTNKKGIVKMGYRMPDESKRIFLVASLQERSDKKIIYTVQGKATNPENMGIIGREEVSAIVGLPMSAPFTVRLTDKNNNPVPDLMVNFVLVDQDGIEVSKETVRSSKSGSASTKLKTPKEVGEYSVLVNLKALPEIETGYSLNVLPGAAANIKVVSGNNQAVDWGKETKSPLVMQALDEMNNPIPDVEVKWKKSREMEWVEREELTDEQGMARAKVKVNDTKRKDIYLFANIGQVKTSFKILPKEPSIYKLHLLTNPIVKVFVDQQLPKDIVLVLKDQYNKRLPDTKVEFEYSIVRRGVSYQQKLNALTDKNGIVSINFLASDQKDEINFQAKYFPGKKPVITWVKIDVIPEDITLVEVSPKIVTTTVMQSYKDPFKVFIGDNYGRPVPEIYLDVIPLRAPPGELEKLTSLRIKTDKKGRASFNPVIGQIFGPYVYKIQLKDLFKTVTINGVADAPETIEILNVKRKKYPVGIDVQDIKFRAYDKYKNIIFGGLYFYNVSNKKQAVKHDFNKKTYADQKGMGRLSFIVPEKEGTYFLYVTDEKYQAKAFYPFKAKGSVVGNLTLRHPIVEELSFTVAQKVKDIFAFQATDRFGNPVRKEKISLDIYSTTSNSSVKGVDVNTNKLGVGSFSFIMPEKAGKYIIKIYPAEANTVEQLITINLFPEVVDEVLILSGNNQEVKVNNRFTTEFKVMAKDIFENPVDKAQIRWSYIRMVKGEARDIVVSRLTDSEGLSTFNFAVDNVPGIREIKASFQKNKKWVDLTFYIKIFTNEAEKIKKIAGDKQISLPGKQLNNYIAVRVNDAKGFPIANLPVLYDIRYKKGKEFKKLSPLTNRTDDRGISKVKLIAPVMTGAYEVWISPKNNPFKKVKFSFTVKESLPEVKTKYSEEIPHVYKQRELKKLNIIPLEKQNIIISVNAQRRLCGVLLTDRLNSPIVDKKIKWEISEVRTNKKFFQESSTNKQGITYLPGIDLSYPRKMKVKIIEEETESVYFYYVDVIKLDKKKSTVDKFIGFSRAIDELRVQDPTVEDSDKNLKEAALLNMQREEAEQMVQMPEMPTSIIAKLKSALSINRQKSVIPDDGILLSIVSGNIKNQDRRVIDLFTNSYPFIVKLGNQSNVERNIIVEIKARNFYQSLDVMPNSIERVEIAPAYITSKERLKIYEQRVTKRVLLREYKLRTADSSKYSLLNRDSRKKTSYTNEPTVFNYGIMSDSSKAKEQLQLGIEVRRLEDNKVISSSVRFVQPNKNQTYEYLFKDKGAYLVEFGTRFTRQKLAYYVEVQKRDVIFEKLTGFGKQKISKNQTRVTTSFKLLNANNKQPVMDEEFIWEVLHTSQAADISYKHRSATNKKGIASNIIVFNNVKGNYVVRARSLFKPDRFIDFLIILY